MSHATGAVLILPESTRPDALTADLSDPSDAELGATVHVAPSPMGFVIAVLRIPTRRFLASETRDPVIDRARRWFLSGLDAGALLGFLTRFEHHLDPEDLEQRVLVPLLAEDWDDLVSESWEWFAIGSPLFGRVARGPDWIEVVQSNNGVLFQREGDSDPWSVGGAA